MAIVHNVSVSRINLVLCCDMYLQKPSHLCTKCHESACHQISAKQCVHVKPGSAMKYHLKINSMCRQYRVIGLLRCLLVLLIDFVACHIFLA